MFKLCNLFFKSEALLTSSALFFFNGITAAFIGERCGLSFKTTLSLPSPKSSTLYASFMIAKTPLSTPAEGSIT